MVAIAVELMHVVAGDYLMVGFNEVQGGPCGLVQRHLDSGSKWVGF